MIRGTRTALAESLPRGERRTQARRRDEAERKILDAAEEIVAELGFEGLTLAQVGDRAGCSRGLPSHYFPTKGDLLSALGRYIVESYNSRRKKQTMGAVGYEGLISSFRYYFTMTMEEPLRARAFHTVLAGALHAPPLAESVARLNRDSRAEIVLGLRAGIESGQIRPDIDLETHAVYILAALRGCVAQWLLDPAAVDLVRAGERFVSNLQQDLAR